MRVVEWMRRRGDVSAQRGRYLRGALGVSSMRRASQGL